jgi:hypothetical protein
VCPDAGHGFLNDHDPDDLSRLDKVIAKLAAAGYHEPSARDARTRISPSSALTSSTRQRKREPLQPGMFLGQCLLRFDAVEKRICGVERATLIQ